MQHFEDLITVGGHELTKNLTDSSDQTITHIDVYADYLSALKPRNQHQCQMQKKKKRKR